MFGLVGWFWITYNFEECGSYEKKKILFIPQKFSWFYYTTTASSDWIVIRNTDRRKINFISANNDYRRIENCSTNISDVWRRGGLLFLSIKQSVVISKLVKKMRFCFYKKQTIFNDEQRVIEFILGWQLGNFGFPSNHNSIFTFLHLFFFIRYAITEVQSISNTSTTNICRWKKKVTNWLSCMTNSEHWMKI